MPYPQELAVPTYAKGTAPVGTPVKVFAPYAAPAFTSPAVALGQVVTGVTLQSTAAMDQVNVPFTFGQVFKRGDLAPDCALVGSIAGKADLPLQVNIKATHDDGSVRHAIISGVLPSLPGGTSVVMGLKRVTPSGGAQSVALPSALPSAKVSIGGVAYTATPTAAMKCDTWFLGQYASDFIFNVPFVDAAGNQHPTLTAPFSVRAYSNGAVRVDAVIEHCKAYSSTTDITYDVTLSANGTTVYSQTGLVHAPAARWKKSFWYGTAPSLHVKHDTAYLIGSRAVPNYDQTVKVSEATLQGYADSLAKGGFGPMQFGRFTSYMGTTGGRPEIGLMPDSYAATLLSMDKRAKDLMLASADAAGSWMSHRRDDSKGPNQGMPLSVINFPYATVLGNPGDADNPLTGKNEKLPSLTSVSSQGADSSHQAAFAYLPYLLTGDYYYLEELHFWASFNSYLDNCWYRQFEKALVSPDQLRGQGWSLRTLAECAAITPDAHPNKQNYIYWYECNMSYYNTAYIDVPDPRYGNQLGIIANGYSVVYSMNGGASNGTAPWQDDFFTQALGHGVELLGYESAKRLLTWKSKFQIGRLLAPGTCIQNAAIYALGVRKDQASPFFATLAECMDFTLPAEQKAAACNSPERLALASSKCLPGDIDGYPNSTEGYPSNYQPALAAAVDSGYVDGLKAWAMFAARPTKPDYSTGAQFAIVPRLVTEVTPPPAPDPAPAPTPAPEPTPTPTPTPTTVAGTIKGPTNTKLVKLTGLSMTVFAPSTMTVVKRFTNLTASSKGVLIVKDVALAPGTVYAAVVADNTGKVLDVMYPLTAV